MCWCVAILFFGCWEIGLMIYLGLRYFDNSLGPQGVGEYGDAIQFIGLSIPLLALAIQAPLWYFRIYLGWRFINPDRATVPTRPLAIHDYFIGTAIAAFSLACARIAAPPAWINDSYWSVWAIVFASVAGMSLASLPALIMVFRIRNWAVGLFLIGLYAFACQFPVIIALAIFDTSFRNQLFRSGWLLDFVFMSVLLVVFGLFLGVGIKVLRDLGYSLTLTRSASR
jgi:hypothetical protein